MESIPALIAGQEGSNLVSQEEVASQEMYRNRIPLRETRLDTSIQFWSMTEEETFRFETGATCFDLGGDRTNLVFNGAPRPWLPPKVLRLLKKSKKVPLSESEMTTLIEEVATISAEFYKIKSGKFIALEPDGHIIDSDNSATDLLMKVQNRPSSRPYFVWHVGSKFYSGWEP